MKSIISDIIVFAIIICIGYGIYNLIVLSPGINLWINNNAGIVITLMMILAITLPYLGIRFALWKIDREIENFNG